jgi:hypothetical protein
MLAGTVNPSCAGTVIQYIDETSTGKNIAKTFAGLYRASRLYQ